MHRIVVTGATSMIGVALVKECITKGIKVLAIVRKHSLNIDRLPKSSLIEICECDLSELNSSIEYSEPYDVFYHMAWEDTLKAQRDNPVLQEKNIKYTLDAVNLAQKLGCKKFIGAGSQAEYGKVDTVISPETAAEPLTAYGMAKYSAGILSRKLCQQYEIIHIWARIFSVYGCYDKEGTMLNYAIDCFVNGNTAKFSSATQMWDYLHEKDAGKFLYLIGEYSTHSRIYCVANGESRPLREFIMELRDLCNPDAKCEFAEKTDSESEEISLQVNIEALIQDTGYRPQIQFQEGIADVVYYSMKKQ